MEPDERFEIQLSHLCNNRCVFCVSGQQTQLRRTKPTALGDLAARFDDARDRGIRKVTIMGGEPTIHPTFFPILDYAIELGFETIVIFTNGARFNRRAFIDRVLERGHSGIQWRISIQGWDEATHDATTKKPGAFARIEKGIATLAELGQHVSCNMCVVEENYRSLSVLPDFVTRFPIQQVHLDMVRPRDSGERTDDYLDALMPDYVSLGRVMNQMFEDLHERAPDFDINVGNLPFCHLPAWSHRVHHGGNKTFTASADGPGEVSVAWDKYKDKRSDKLKLDSCGECVFEARCDGFVELYAERRGTATFVPVSLDRLRRVDPRQRAFLHHVDAALRALSRKTMLGFALVHADESEHDRRARLIYRDATGAEATLLVLPTDTSGPQDGVHRDFILRIDRWHDVQGDRLLALANQVYETLSAALDDDAASIVERPTLAAFRARLGMPAEADTLPVAIAARLGLLLRRSSPTSGFRLTGATRHSQLPGVSVHYANTKGARATLHLVEEHGRFTGKWDFDGLPRDEGRLLAGALKELLRPPRAAAPAHA